MFIKEDFLLTSDFAKKIYEAIKDLPIIDYHCHINAKEIYDDKVFNNLTEAWLYGDHYKWRAMRHLGLAEPLVTGPAPDLQRFMAYAVALPPMPGHPLYHFSQLELKNYFGINEPLTDKNAPQIYDKTAKMLKTLPVRKLIKMSNVELIGTTNDPTEDLKYHELIAKEADITAKVLPAFRPDKALNIEKPAFVPYMKELSGVIGAPINSLSALKDALLSRLAYFIKHGCVASDHGMDYVPYYADARLAEVAFEKAIKGHALSKQETDAYKTDLLVTLAKAYRKNNIVMEVHFGVQRNNNSRAFNKLGPDAGFDSIFSATEVQNLVPLLNAMDITDGLPKTILYSLDPTDNTAITSIMGSFYEQGIVGKVQHGSAWWFNDNLDGMREQIKNYASQAPLSSFIGMLTDSRSFLSYARHEYFRRILAEYLGNLVASGQYPETLIGNLVNIAKDIACNNARKFFGLK